MIFNKNVKKTPEYQNIMTLALVLAMLIGCVIYAIHLHKQLTYTTEKLNIVSTEKEAVEIQLSDTKQELENTNTELSAAQDEIKRQAEEIEVYRTYIEDEEAKWQRRREEYATATEVWTCMKSYGWSDIVCAGIMGNLMAETGGSGTLYLDWDSNGKSGYGLVQWTSGRRNTIKKLYGKYPSVQEQVQFIYDELYGTNGVRRQVTNAQFNAIMNAKTPEKCAYAFACYYERCGSEYRSMRKGFARKAYEYFTA